MGFLSKAPFGTCSKAVPGENKSDHQFPKANLYVASIFLSALWSLPVGFSGCLWDG